MLLKDKGKHFTTQREGHVDVAKVLIQNGADVNAVEKENGHHITRSSYGHADAAKVLLRRCRRECCSGKRITALHLAAQDGHVGVAKC